MLGLFNLAPLAGIAAPHRRESKRCLPERLGAFRPYSKSRPGEMLRNEMNKYLRSLSVAAWIEFAVAAIWVLIVVAFLAWNSSLQPGPFPILLFVMFAPIGAVPALITALVLRRELRTESRRLTGTVLAFILTLTFVGLGVVVAMGGGRGPFGMTPEMTLVWVYVPVGLVAVLHAAAGVIVLMARRGLSAEEPPRQLGSPTIGAHA